MNGTFLLVLAVLRSQKFRVPCGAVRSQWESSGRSLRVSTPLLDRANEMATSQPGQAEVC